MDRAAISNTFCKKTAANGSDKKSMKFLEPTIFKPYKSVTAIFTEKNAEIIHSERTIPGLNFGLNTNISKEEIQKNIDILCEETGWKKTPFALAEQVHDTHVEFVSSPGIFSETDALITNKKNLAIGIQVADCAAVLISDPESGVIGASHAGWRGAAAGVVKKTVNLMISAGARPDRMIAYISPSISQENFEVGHEVAVQFPDEFVDFSSYDKPHLNLKGFLKYQLLQTGIPPSQIEVSGYCTINDADKFYSYRRERKKSGRMLGIIKLEK